MKLYLCGQQVFNLFQDIKQTYNLMSTKGHNSVEKKFYLPILT